MVTLQARERPGPEAVRWNGVNTNEGELLALCQRVAALDVWPPLWPGCDLTWEVHADDELHPGCSIVNNDDDGRIVARVDQPGDYLVFDLFAPTPLYAATNADLVAFYQIGP